MANIFLLNGLVKIYTTCLILIANSFRSGQSVFIELVTWCIFILIGLLLWLLVENQNFLQFILLLNQASFSERMNGEQTDRWLSDEWTEMNEEKASMPVSEKSSVTVVLQKKRSCGKEKSTSRFQHQITAPLYLADNVTCHVKDGHRGFKKRLDYSLMLCSPEGNYCSLENVNRKNRHCLHSALCPLRCECVYSSSWTNQYT